MATRKSSIGADLVIDRRKFKAALEASKGDAVAFAKSLEAIKAPRSGALAGEGVGGGSDSRWAAMGGKVAVAKAALEGLSKIKDKLAEPEKVEMEFETALAGLAAVQDGAETLEEQLKALSELGDKPGLGFQQVMEASVGLQAVGQSAKEARKTMEQFGNAVALVGGGKQEFGEVMVSLRQILSTGSVDMENLKEIAARISYKQLEIEEARAEGNEEGLAQLEQELRMMTEGKEIMEKTGLAAEVVADHLQRRADNEKEIERLKETAGQGEFMATANEDMEIARLRSRGKNKQADKMEADRAERQRVEQLMKEGGLSEKDAKKMAAGERQIQEDSDYLSRTGRRKGRGADFKTGFTGLDDYHQSDSLMGMKDEWNFDRLDAAKADRRNRPLKSQLDREAGKPSIKPDATSGMTIKQADEMLEVLRAIRSATEKSQPTVGERLSPRAA